MTWWVIPLHDISKGNFGTLADAYLFSKNTQQVLLNRMQLAGKAEFLTWPFLYCSTDSKSVELSIDIFIMNKLLFSYIKHLQIKEEIKIDKKEGQVNLFVFLKKIRILIQATGQKVVKKDAASRSVLHFSDKMTHRIYNKNAFK